jgi:hypothetical protein
VSALPSISPFVDDVPPLVNSPAPIVSSVSEICADERVDVPSRIIAAVHVARPPRSAGS